MPLSVPVYPDSRPIDIADRSLLRGIFSVLQPAISELTFANLFLFRHIHAYRLTLVTDCLTVFGSGYDGRAYFLPPLCGEAGEAARELLADGKTLYGADDRFVAEYLDGFPCTIHPDRDNDDYLYLRSDLAELPGNRFHKQKNRISYFTSRQSYGIEPFGREHRESALHLLDEWARVHGNGLSSSLAAEVADTRGTTRSARGRSSVSSRAQAKLAVSRFSSATWHPRCFSSRSRFRARSPSGAALGR